MAPRWDRLIKHLVRARPHEHLATTSTPPTSTPTRSDGERGGDEYCDEYSWSIGAEDAMGAGEFGGGPWSGEDPGAYGGVG